MAEATDNRLRLLIERIERLEEEKKGIAEDIRDVYAEAKAHGYDPKIMRQVVRLRKMDPSDRAEMEAVLECYKAALGFDTTPLGKYRQHLSEMDEKGIGVSIGVGNGPMTPMNETAREKAAQAAEA